jgi:hypothetical protein
MQHDFQCPAGIRQVHEKGDKSRLFGSICAGGFVMLVRGLFKLASVAITLECVEAARGMGRSRRSVKRAGILGQE